MTRLIENELKLIKYITESSDFNGDSLDFAKDFSEQQLEAVNVYESIVILKYFNRELGTNNAGSRAVLGSLVKKNMIQLEEDCGTNWIYIYEEHFNNIKEALKEMGA